jgi:hypothetical protein
LITQVRYAVSHRGYGRRAAQVTTAGGSQTGGVHLRTARNPAADARLAYLLHVPWPVGLAFRTSGTWLRTIALYCHLVPADEWPSKPQIVEQVPPYPPASGRLTPEGDHDYGRSRGETSMTLTTLLLRGLAQHRDDRVRVGGQPQHNMRVVMEQDMIAGT